MAQISAVNLTVIGSMVIGSALFAMRDPDPLHLAMGVAGVVVLMVVYIRMTNKTTVALGESGVDAPVEDEPNKRA